MKFGYARVSTLAQSLDDQINQLLNLGISSDNIYSDKFTGKTTNRPELNKLLDQLRSGDELAVIKLDRLARNAKEGLELIDELNNRGVSVNIKNMGVFTADDSAITKMMKTMFLAFAEFERAQIVERMQIGKDYAKLTDPNFKEGRPKKVLGIRERNVLEFRKTHSIKETAQQFGISTFSVKKWQRIERGLE
ncbi:recombinase family protein [Dellaglioa sp. L3N]